MGKQVPKREAEPSLPSAARILQVAVVVVGVGGIDHTGDAGDAVRAGRAGGGVTIGAEIGLGDDVAGLLETSNLYYHFCIIMFIKRINKPHGFNNTKIICWHLTQKDSPDGILLH